MTLPEPNSPPDYSLLAHEPDGTPVCALACGPDYAHLRDLLLTQRAHTELRLLILPTAHIKQGA